MAELQAQARLLAMLTDLCSGQTLTTADVAAQYHVSPRTAQRDLEHIQTLKLPDGQSMVTKTGTRPARYSAHTSAQVEPGLALMLAKMVLDSRGLDPVDLQKMIDAVVSLAPSEAVESLRAAVHEEMQNYQPISSSQPRTKLIWQLQKAIEQRALVTLEYCDREKQYLAKTEVITAVPLALSFNHHYFYLMVCDDATGAVRELHMDWISTLQRAGQGSKQLPAPEVGAHRRLQAYGYRGEHLVISFEYYGLFDYVHDQYPTARVVRTIEGKHNPWPFPVIQVEMDVEYSSGVRMWLITQSPILRVLSPQFVVAEVKEHLQLALSRYED